MKKNVFLLGILLMGSAVFAQRFSISGHLAADFESVRPALGIEANLSKIDFLAGVNFWFNRGPASADYQTDTTAIQYWVGIFAGIAPKVSFYDTVTLSFPLTARVQFGNSSYDSDAGSPKEAVYFGYGFDAGARVYYKLTRRWSIYAGALMRVLSISDNKYIYAAYTRETSGMQWLAGGEIALGVRFTF